MVIVLSTMKANTIIVRDGTPFIQVECHHGSVHRMDVDGKVESRGQLMDGIESELFYERDENQEIKQSCLCENGEMNRSRMGTISYDYYWENQFSIRE